MSSPFVIILPINICSACFVGHFVDPHSYPVRSIITSAFHVSTTSPRCIIHPIGKIILYSLHVARKAIFSTVVKMLEKL